MVNWRAVDGKLSKTDSGDAIVPAPVWEKLVDMLCECYEPTEDPDGYVDGMARSRLATELERELMKADL